MELLITHHWRNVERTLLESDLIALRWRKENGSTVCIQKNKGCDALMWTLCPTQAYLMVLAECFELNLKDKFRDDKIVHQHVKKSLLGGANIYWFGSSGVLNWCRSYYWDFRWWALDYQLVSSPYRSGAAMGWRGKVLKSLFEE